MARRVTYGVGAHEPIFHRMRTGNAMAEEWQRWDRETSEENLDLLAELGVTRATIACCKGFGLEYEKPIIERAVRFAEGAAARGIATSLYVQGFPVYYETFLLEVPAAADWLARDQDGRIMPWGAQTFRRWMDPTRTEFHDYLRNQIAYVMDAFASTPPAAIMMDNTFGQPCYTDASLESYRAYLRERFDGVDLVRKFGLPSFDAVDLPRFDPIYWPEDAYRVVKDPLLQEWARWRSKVRCNFLAEMRDFVHARLPDTRFQGGAGCDTLRYNALFSHGVDFEDRLDAFDDCWMEESGWRPGAFEAGDRGRQIVKDERIALGTESAEISAVRVSTDSRWWKAVTNYARRGHGGFWGEVDRESKLVALAHNFTFSSDAHNLGTIGPLAAAGQMLDDIRDVIDWADAHTEILFDRDERIAPIAVWRGTSTIGFIRHRPVWEACAVEQMLYENHLPFTILFDGGLERFLDGHRVLVLPGTACVSDEQTELITGFVESGGSLLLLGAAGTRDEWTRVRRKHAFAHLFGQAMGDLEYFGPPHWVPELRLDALDEALSADYGKGKAALIKNITPIAELDLTRDPYSPHRQVMPKDILPPANEADIMARLCGLVGDVPRGDGPRWTLCEFWRRKNDMLICLANLSKTRPGGPVTLHLGPSRAKVVTVHSLGEDGVTEMPVHDGKVELARVDRFCAVVVPNSAG